MNPSELSIQSSTFPTIPVEIISSKAKLSVTTPSELRLITHNGHVDTPRTSSYLCTVINHPEGAEHGRVAVLIREGIPRLSARFGGRFIFSTDDRFRETVLPGPGGSYPIPLWDIFDERATPPRPPAP